MERISIMYRYSYLPYILPVRNNFYETNLGLNLLNSSE